MKKLLLSIGILACIIACSSDDDNSSEEVYYSFIVYLNEEDCGSGENKATYCVTKEEYYRVMDLDLPPCAHFAFVDIDGAQRTAYRSSMVPSNENPCE